jgi:hypothetical protein
MLLGNVALNQFQPAGTEFYDHGSVVSLSEPEFRSREFLTEPEGTGHQGTVQIRVSEAWLLSGPTTIV